MISWIDHKVGELLNELDRLGLADTTAVVFSSDHGEMLGDHGQWSKRLLLEWSARVPLIVRMPGRAGAGKRISQPVSLVDLLPTFNSFAGVKTDLPFDGKSLAPLIAGAEEDREAVVISEYLGEGAIEPMRMVRQGWHKYITVNGYGPQLYDLRKDGEETTNMAGSSHYSTVEKVLASCAQNGWDGPALKRSVVADQQQRILLRAIAKDSETPRWDYVTQTGRAG
jgi:choline-sulfatase